MVVVVALAVAAGCTPTTGGIGAPAGFFGLGPGLSGIGGDPGARIPDEPLPDRFVRLGKAPVGHNSLVGNASVRISPSGRYVGFVSDEAGLTADADEPGTLDVFLLDRATGDHRQGDRRQPPPPSLFVDIRIGSVQDTGLVAFSTGCRNLLDPHRRG